MRRCKRGKRLDQLANEKRKTNEMISGDKAVSNDIHLKSKRNGYMRQYKRRMRLSGVRRERKQNRSNRERLDFVTRMIKSFQSSIESGPQYICTCCGQL